MTAGHLVDLSHVIREGMLAYPGLPVQLFVPHLTGPVQLPSSGGVFTAVPPKVEEFGTFPVRAYARLP